MRHYSDWPRAAATWLLVRALLTLGRLYLGVVRLTERVLDWREVRESLPRQGRRF